MKVLADHPAKTVYAVQGAIILDNDKGYVRTLSIPVFLEKFEGDRYTYVRSFTIGIDPETSVPFVYGNGAMISSTPGAKGVAFGVSLGDVITVEGVDYTVEPDHNHNIKLTEA